MKTSVLLRRHNRAEHRAESDTRLVTMMRLHEGVSRIVSLAGRSPASGPAAGIVFFVVAAIAILMIESPTGVLSLNQEHYFGLAENAVCKDVDENSALFDSARHRIAADWAIGALVCSLGYEGAQASGAVLLAAAYAGALLVLARSLLLSPIVVGAAIILFYYFGSDLYGGEWLFHGLESKTLAYPLVILSVALFLLRAPIKGAVAAAGATYFHFQVGGYWFAFLILVWFLHERDLRRAVKVGGVYSLLVLPLLIIIVQDQLGSAGLIEDDIDLLYARLRMPHHVDPFASTYSFAFDWLPGIMTATVWLALWGALRRSIRTAASYAEVFIGDLAALALGFTLVGVVVTAFDDEAVFGKFLLFRPTSLALLLGLLMAFSLASRLGKVRFQSAVLVGLLLVGPFFASNSLGSNLVEFLNDRETKRRYDELSSHLGKDAVVLIDPDLESNYLALERRTGLKGYVTWKFFPTHPTDIARWRDRMHLKDHFFSNICGTSSSHRISDAALTTAARVANQEIDVCARRIMLSDGRILLLLGE